MDIYTNVTTHRNKILCRGIDSDGNRFNRQLPFQPMVWTNTKEKTTWKNLEGEYLESNVFSSIKEAKDFVDRYKDVDGINTSGNFRFEYQWIYMNHPGVIKWDMKDILVANIDIEVDSDEGFPEPDVAEHPITAITIDYFDEVIVLGHDAHKTMKKFVNNNDKLTYIDCSSEQDLITTFLALWGDNCPDIVTGWNIEGFDIPYLHNRITKILGETNAKKLSPWKNIWSRETRDGYGNKQTKYKITGVAIIDYMLLYKKYAPPIPLDNFKLGTVGETELGMSKIDFQAASLHELYKTDFQTYLDYNIRDTAIIRGLEKKHKLLQMVASLAYDGKFNFEDVFQQVRMWDVLTTNYLLDRNIVVPDFSPGEESTFMGGYVQEPVTGFHKYIASFDLDSLYPHLIMQYNISPETLIDSENWTDDMQAVRQNINTGNAIENIVNQRIDLLPLRHKDFCMAANGEFFTNTKMGFLPAMMREMYESRKQFKSDMIQEKIRLENFAGTEAEREEINTKITQYNCLQLAKKVCLNSAYGACGNRYFRFFDIRLASAITHSGQLSIKWIAARTNEYMNNVLGNQESKNYIIASDTDSIYLSLQDIIEKVNPKGDVIDFMDNICSSRITNHIQKSFQDLADTMNAYEQKMNMKRECLADKGIWTAKKKYVLNVWDDEGVRLSQPKLKITGIEAIKSSTSLICRDKIKEGLRIIMSGTNQDVIDFIKEFKIEFSKMKPQDIARQTSINGLAKYQDGEGFRKGTPIHVRAAIKFNALLEKKNLTSSYDVIHEGEQIKYIFLKEPNTIQSNVIALLYELPPEFELDEYIDYDTLFDKTFVEPMKNILDKIGWTVEKRNSLEDLWA